MKSFILMTLFILGSASGSIVGSPLNKRISLSEGLAKAFQTQLPPRNARDPVDIHNEPDNSYVDFIINYTFNLIGLKYPPGYLIQNVIQLIMAQTNGQPSVWDQLKDKVKAVVVNGVTTYHLDSLYVKIKVLESKFDSLWRLTIEHHPSNFLTEAVQLHTDMYNSRSEFFPTSFVNSITYDYSIIVCMTRYATMFMALNKEINNYYSSKGLREDGILGRLRAQKKIFLESAGTAATLTYTWALDKRQEDIVTVHVRANEYVSCDTATQSESDHQHNSHHCYASQANNVRQSLRALLEEILIGPLNVFLEDESLSLLQSPREDRTYPTTISGERCTTPCTQGGSSYWWCGIFQKAAVGPRAFGSSFSWNYCSPPYLGKQKTVKGEDCKGNRCIETWKGKNYCYTDSSWDYCSMQKPYDEKSLPPRFCLYYTSNTIGSYYWDPSTH